MTTKLANPIKTQIKADLDALVTAGSLGAAQMVDYSKDVFTADYSAFPVAILGMSSVESEASDNRDNLRTYTFPILVIQKSENLTAQTDMEDLRDAILNQIDTDLTLAGKAVGGVLPVASPAQTMSVGDKSLVYFVITIKAKTIYQLGT